MIDRPSVKVGVENVNESKCIVSNVSVNKSVVYLGEPFELDITVTNPGPSGINAYLEICVTDEYGRVLGKILRSIPSSLFITGHIFANAASNTFYLGPGSTMKIRIIMCIVQNPYAPKLRRREKVQITVVGCHIVRKS